MNGDLAVTIARAFRRVALPLAAYYAVTVAVPLANGAAQYIGVNEEACRLTGRSRDQLLEMSVWDLTPQIALADGQREWANFVARGMLTGAYRLNTPEGSAVDATFAAAANILPGCHLSLLNRLPTALVP